MQNRYKPNRTRADWLAPSSDLTTLVRSLGSLSGAAGSGIIGRFADSPTIDGERIPAPAAWHPAAREVIVDARQATPGQTPDQVRINDRSWRRRNRVAMGLIAHEMGHAAFTPKWFGEWVMSVQNTIGPEAANLLIVSEEARMERCVARGGYTEELRAASDRLILRDLDADTTGPEAAILIGGRSNDYGGCLDSDRTKPIRKSLQDRGYPYAALLDCWWRHYGGHDDLNDRVDRRASGYGITLEEARAGIARDYWDEWHGILNPPSDGRDAGGGEEGEDGPDDDSEGSEAMTPDGGAEDGGEEGENGSEGEGEDGPEGSDGEDSGMSGIDDTETAESGSAGQSAGQAEGSEGEAEESDNPDSDLISDLRDSLAERAETAEERAKEQAEAEESAEQEMDSEATKSIVQNSNSDGPGRFPNQGEEMAPESTDRQLARHLSETMKRIQTPDVRKVKRSAALPPGRLSGRGAVQRSAEMAAGQAPHTDIWKRPRKTTTRVPPPVIGVMVDVSGSMGQASAPMASLLWAFGESARAVNARFAAVHYGERARLHKHDARAKRFVPANGGTENFTEAFGILDQWLHLSEREDRARLLVIVSDGSYGGYGQKTGTQQILRHLERQGVSVLWVHVPPAYAPNVAGSGNARIDYPGSLVKMDAPTPAAAARQLGEAIETVLERDAQRRIGGGW